MPGAFSNSEHRRYAKLTEEEESPSDLAGPKHKQSDKGKGLHGSDTQLAAERSQGENLGVLKVA
jgi:hypothetical protein